MIGLGLFMFSVLLARYRRTLVGGHTSMIRFVRIMVLLTPILYIGTGLFVLVFLRPPDPPFGF